MTKTRRGQSEDTTANLTKDIREEVSKAIEDNSELLDTLISKVKVSLIEELTTLITQKVAENIKERIDFELAERDDRIAKLQKEIDSMKDKQDEAEQYSRRNCLILHGITEKDVENTDVLVRKLCEEKLDVKLGEHDIDRSHRLGAKAGKTKGIIVKFTNYTVRDRVYQSRKKLRNLEGTQIYIQESLTKVKRGSFLGSKIETQTSCEEHLDSRWPNPCTNER